MYTPNEKRYERMIYNRVGNSGLRLPALSLGMWQNFGSGSDFETAGEMCRTAFDLGITHFDLANNYGHPDNGSAESNFGEILRRGLGRYRDELIISTKAGYEMWPGPYGSQHGSRKYLIASLDQSLRRMGLDYVDIYYHHVYDRDAPLEEIAVALDHIVRQGKALYVGVSNYDRKNTAKIHEIFRELKTPFIINQPSFSMLNRWLENDGLDRYCLENGIGMAVFSPLQRGLLSDRSLNEAPGGKLSSSSAETVEKLRSLGKIAAERHQTLSQMALAWLLNNKAVSTVLMGASSPSQITENVRALDNLDFTEEEMRKINAVLK